MAKAHRRRRRRAPNTGGTRRRRRTTVKHHATTHRRRRSYRMNAGGKRRRTTYRTRRRINRRHNAGGGMSFGAEIMDTVWLVAGAVGTQMLTQMVLGTNNTGLIGYAGNGVAGFALSFVASKVLKQPKIGRAIFKGAILQIVLRAIRDYTPFGSYLSNVGMGDYIASNWVTPQIYADPNNSAMVVPPNGWGTGITAAPAAASARGVSGYPQTSDYSMFPGLYN